MFRGEFNHSIDAKGRVIIPAKFREELGERFVITKENGGCLAVHPMDKWEVLEKKLESLPRRDFDVQRYFLGSASEEGIDKQGRTLVPIALREFAGIEKEVVIVGILDRVEIWDKAKWIENNANIEVNISDKLDALDF